ncbi:hypothetical protein KG088_19395 [Halomonas sp. TRM85114]|uniref:hypothetical protein n=1 Tax=Halomonas jincaotanensis TaxID=2810616 RepID=UPI001BD32187|nr:hypothetical protein [Halomonas jincaotanensis]MBS9405736.1 hypothetical protein [Halomonas jincaotanensis]
MKPKAQISDEQAIEAVIERQFSSLSWTPGESADWGTFKSDFFPDAPLYPAIRPVKQQSVNAFIKRLSGLAETNLRSFDEKVLGTEVRVFGNVAVAVAGCETVENETEVNRGVEMLLLVKDAGRWRIAGQAWDSESDEVKVPPYLKGVEGT